MICSEVWVDRQWLVCVCGYEWTGPDAWNFLSLVRKVARASDYCLTAFQFFPPAISLQEQVTFWWWSAVLDLTLHLHTNISNAERYDGSNNKGVYIVFFPPKIFTFFCVCLMTNLHTYNFFISAHNFTRLDQVHKQPYVLFSLNLRVNVYMHLVRYLRYKRGRW